MISGLQKDRNGNIWIATLGGGINCLDVEAIKFKSFTVKDGLPSNTINDLLIDEAGNLWLSTADGIAKFNPSTKKSRNYDVLDGLQGNEFERFVSLKTSTGHLLFGGSNGFNYFHPDSIVDNPVIPKILLTDLKIFNKPVSLHDKNSPLKEHITLAKEITFTHKQWVITFGFVALNFSTPEKNQYAYILEGFENEWNYIGKLRTATYTNLPHGTYTFRVKASNNDGTWNETGTAIKIIVLPPWWKTWWFRIFVIIVVVGGSLGFYFIRVAALKRQQRQLEQKVQERTAELQEANVLLEERQEEILQQNEEIVEQNEKITRQNEKINGSIQYAKTIQNAIFPIKENMDQLFDNFLIYRPKDVVSGDFYWMEATDDFCIIAVVDCTGHGVPGAFMSLIGSRLLDEIVKVQKIYQPVKILERLSQQIKIALKQDILATDDGMDICLCRIERCKNSDGSTNVIFAGARRPIRMYSNALKDVITIKGCLKSIGGSITTDFEFAEHEITAKPNDVLYLTTDGFTDQNDVHRKKYGAKQLIQLLKQIGELPLNEQKAQLEKALNLHQQNEMQRDDITIVGVKI